MVCVVWFGYVCCVFVDGIWLWGMCVVVLCELVVDVLVVLK